MKLSSISPQPFLLAAAVLLFSVSAFAQEKTPTEAKAKQITRASSGTVVRALLVPATESVLSSQVSAQIIKIAVSEGKPFKKGAVLVILTIHE